MDPLLSLIPFTALVAIAVFAVKETIEFFRRRSGDRRRIRALTALLARECELNYWTIKSLRRVFVEVATDENPDTAGSVTVEKKPSGRAYAKVMTEDGGLEAHYSIPHVHRELMSKFLLDIATLDEKLFDVMEPAYDALAEVEHVRESLLNASEAPEEIGEDGYMEGLAGYALDELRDAETALSALYKHCSGEVLTKHRLR